MPHPVDEKPPAPGGHRLLPLMLAIVLGATACAATPPARSVRTAAVPPADGPAAARLRERAAEMVLTAMNYLGTPYRLGGSSQDDGFDCSGFTQYLFGRSLGVALPRSVDEQAVAPALASVPRSALEPGDLVFFNTLRRTYSHVGIYVGEGRFIHAPRTGAAIRIENLAQDYWSRRYTGARRASLPAGQAPMPVDAAALY